VWNKYPVNKLTTEVSFVQSEVDECVFYRGTTMYALYTDNSILAGPDKNEIDDIVKDMKALKLDITEEGDLEDFLGVNMERKPYGTRHLTQPHLIDQILDNLQLNNKNVMTKKIPALSSKILSRHSESEDFNNWFNYRSVIGKLNYLEKSTRSDISYITHQCARFTSNPKVKHAQALKYLGRYLKETRKMGTILKPVQGMDLEVYVDAAFVAIGILKRRGILTRLNPDMATSLCWVSSYVEISATNGNSFIIDGKQILWIVICPL
jgi:hypothetical protein